MTRAWVDSDATRDMSASRPAASPGTGRDFSGEAGTEDVGDEGDTGSVLQSLKTNKNVKSAIGFLGEILNRTSGFLL
jgi:hypothetical protein